MQQPRLNKIAVEVILLQTSSSGGVTPIKLYKEKKKKKQSRGPMRLPEMLMERASDAQKAFGNTLSKRFRASRRKRRDGWVSDMGGNLLKAMDDGRKQVRLFRFPF